MQSIKVKAKVHDFSQFMALKRSMQAEDPRVRASGELSQEELSARSSFSHGLDFSDARVVPRQRKRV